MPVRSGSVQLLHADKQGQIRKAAGIWHLSGVVIVVWFVPDYPQAACCFLGMNFGCVYRSFVIGA